MAKKTSTTKSSSKKTSTSKKQSPVKPDRKMVTDFSITGLGHPEVLDVLVAEVQKLPTNRASSAAKLALDFDDRFDSNAKKYVEAINKNDAATIKKVRQEEFTLECLFINNMMKLGCSHIIEKMQSEAQKYTKADKNGKKFDMFSVIRHNYIYYPSDIELMKKKGYDFNALHTINGKKMDFTTYNLELLKSAGQRLQTCTKGMYDSIKLVQDKRNAMIEQFEKLEAEKKKASAARKKAIDAEITELNKKFKTLNQQLDLYRAKGDVVIEEFVAARQRLLKAVELGVLSPANVKKIEQANIPQIAEAFQQPYAQFMRLKQVIYKDAEVSQTKNDKNKSVAKTDSSKAGVNKVLASSTTYSPDEKDTATVAPLQLGTPVDVQDNPQLAQVKMDDLAKA